ncbi:MAG: hypothetical protein ACD_62C00620G0009 [uncultured bacterium]|nr:MAG: hypothetical protein ACD_62C00620G0009 [uncultured bacterium]HLD45253.1 hypothetical protein [bacterium]
MGNKYLCPKCRGRLDVHEYVAFTAQAKDGDRGLLLLSPHLGNYDVWHNDNFRYQQGDLVKYFCPICHKNLTAIEFHEHLVRIHMVDGDNIEHNVLFSGVAGEEATYKVRDDEIEPYGQHSNQYMQYFISARM